MAKFKKGDKIRLVEDKDFSATVEKVTKNGYELSNRFKVYFREESDWELDIEMLSQCVDCGEEYKNVILHKSNINENEEEEIEKKIEEYTTLGNCPHYDENASVCDDGDCGCAECISRIRKCEKVEKEEFIKRELECIRGYREKAIERLNKLEKESEPSTHEMEVTTQTEWNDVYAFCHKHLKIDDGEVAKITITKKQK